MNHKVILFRYISVALLAVLTLTACAGSRARVSITQPKDRATVVSPVTVKMSADNFTVEPAGEVRSGAGHLHILVDVPCVPAGEVVPKDEQHLHYGQGQMEAELQLASGKHTLCLQAADGAHVALSGAGMTHTISIEVK